MDLEQLVCQVKFMEIIILLVILEQKVVKTLKLHCKDREK